MRERSQHHATFRGREAQARSHRTVGVAAVGSALLVGGMAAVGAPLAAIGAAALACLAATAAVGPLTRPRAVEDQPPARLLAPAPLPARAQAWLAAQQLPAVAAPRVAALDRRLDELAFPFAHLSPDDSAVAALNRLVGHELPALVAVHAAVPPARRAAPRADGRSADDSLVDGLALVDTALARLADDLTRSAADAVATQQRFLAAKYRGEG